MSEHFTLAGSGLVGSLLSLFLAQRGHKVDVFESRIDMRNHNISVGRSINLALANRGIAPLNAVGLMDKVEQMLIPMKGRMVHDEHGKTNFQSYGQKEDEVIYSISRGGLNKLLMDEAEATGNVTIHFEHRVTDVNLDNKTITCHTHDGDTVVHEFQRLVGTDGAGSQVRQAVLAKKCDQDDISPLGHSYKELSIPPAPGGGFLIEKEALHIWPRGGFMLIALPNLDGSFTVTLFMPCEGDISFETINTPEKLDAFFEEHFADVKPLLKDLHQEYFENPTGTLATVRCAPWNFEETALLLGDAAHAVVPFHGQGMNCGFEDCLDFAVQLDAENPDLFATVADMRKPNGDAIAALAIENYIEMRDSVREPTYLLKKDIAFKLEQWFPERFTPRYSMVMFKLIPYAEAKRLGEIHKSLLADLAEQCQNLEGLTQELAEKALDHYGL